MEVAARYLAVTENVVGRNVDLAGVLVGRRGCRECVIVLALVVAVSGHQCGQSWSGFHRLLGPSYLDFVRFSHHPQCLLPPPSRAKE